MDLSFCKKMCSWSIECILSNCTELAELSLRSTYLCPKSLNLLSNNLTEKVEKLNLEFLDVTDEHVANILKRCHRINEFGLQDTSVTNNAVTNIMEKLPKSLVSLSLSINYPSIYFPFVHFTKILEFLREMPKLRNFYCYGLDVQEERFLNKLFPQLDYRGIKSNSCAKCPIF